jgi:hypothetical protein
MSMRVHVVGAGPVGLLLTALLQSTEGCSVHLCEKRDEYTRTRMVQLEPYLVADSIESYRIDSIDGDSVEAIFDPPELEEALAYRRSIAPDLSALLQGWAMGFRPLNSIERSLSELIDARGHSVERTAAAVTADDAMSMLEPGDILIDATGSKSLLRDHVIPTSEGPVEAANTVTVRLEYALVITFLYGQPYDCNEYCKYYKNKENPRYKFIPMVNRTHYDGAVSHVTGIVSISAEEYEAMPSRFDGEWLRESAPDVARSMDRSSRRSSGRPKARSSATSRSCGYRWTSTARATRPTVSGWQPGRATIRFPAHRSSSRATRQSDRRTSSRSLSASRARCSLRGSSRSGIWQRGRCSIATSCTSTNSGSASTCAAR